MKIAILTERLKTGFGVDLVVHEQASHLAKRHDLTVFAINVDKKFKNSSYKIKKLDIPLHFNPIKQDIESWKCVRKFQDELEKYDAFVIHTPTFNTWISRLKKYGKVIIYYYGNSPSTGYWGLKKYRKNLLDLSERHFHFFKADQIISISNFLKKELPKKIQKKTNLSHLGKEHVTTRKKAVLKEIDKIRSRFFINENDQIITYIGRLDYRSNPYKNTKELIELNKHLKEKNRRVNVKVFALGFPQNQIEQELFRNGVHVIPNATEKELVGVLLLSKIYFSPTRWEGFNLPFLEAQSLGVPIVGYNLGAHPEVVNNGHSGILVNTFEEAVGAIHSILTDPLFQSRLSRGALKQAEKFSWKKNAKNLEEALLA